MALIKSTLLAQISGSINGTTFAHNQGGAYARNRSAVRNPGTNRQDQVRTAMTSLSKMWGESLTQAQRDDWIGYGGAVSVVNRIGDTIHLSGIAAFNRINLFRVGTLGLAPTLNPPSVAGTGSQESIPAFTSASFNAVGLDPVTEIITTAVGSGYSFVVWYSAPLSPGIRFFRGPYAGFATGTGAASTTSEVTLENLAVEDGGFRAMKITMYETASSLVVWTVNVDPQEVPTA